jgi:hypothetical protein
MNRVALTVIAVIVAAGAVSSIAAARANGDTPEARRATRALNLLEAQGYAAGLPDKSFGAFRDLRPHGKDFEATIEQNGLTFVVIVDPDTGRVTRQP